MSDTSSTGSGANADADRRTLTDAARREGDALRDKAAAAGETLRQDGANLGESARRRATEQAEAGKQAAASSLSDFTAAIRKASDELGERDQSMAAGLARQAASGLEQAADAIQGKSVQDITRSVADFARRQPGAFLIGAALAGVALGRFVRASSDHAGPLGASHANDARSQGHDDGRRETSGYGRGSASSPSGSANPAVGSSQADASRLGGTAGSVQNRPGTSGSTDTTGLTGSSSSITGAKA